MFEMKEQYKLGVLQIDEEHEKLFEIGESAFILLNDNYSIDKYDRIVDIIEELVDYTKVHFKDEENYMKQIGYRGLETQIEDHKKFVHKINSLDLNNINKDQDEYIMGIFKFVADWLVHHIIEKDLLITARN